MAHTHSQALTLLTRHRPQYGGHNMALEIQASLPRPPTVRRMLRGVHIAFVFTGIAYLLSLIHISQGIVR